MIDLTGKLALVTGAAGGIGLGIAAVLTAAGARVVINDIHVEAGRAAAERLGGGAVFLAGNVSDEKAVDAVVARVEDLGPLDILVNNAGVSEPLRALRHQTLDVWQHVMDVNLRGPYLMSRAVARGFVARKSGVIVNVSSIAGLTGFPASHAYGVSKAALLMMTKTMASELARYFIRVNAVAPGIVSAPMLGDMTTARQPLDALIGRVPLGRLGEPADIGNAVAFLCSDLAAYITGATLPVDGGWLAFGGAGAAWTPASGGEGYDGRNSAAGITGSMTVSSA